MKKIICIMVVVILIVCCVGCSTKDNENKLKTSNSNIEIWTDEKTGVQYIIYDRNSGYAGMGGITPRYNADGTLHTVDMK